MSSAWFESRFDAFDLVHIITTTFWGKFMFRVKCCLSIPNSGRRHSLILFGADWLRLARQSLKTHNIGIQMKQKELTRSFCDVFNLKKTLWSPWFIQKYFSVVRVNNNLRFYKTKLLYYMTYIIMYVNDKYVRYDLLC